MLAIFDDGANRLAPKVIRLYSALIAVNLLVWVWAFAAFHSYPLLLATALIAYGFGLRHAVDADHIAAIDNITRKLMQEDKRPITVGLFFLIGDKFGLEGGLWVMADATGASFRDAWIPRDRHFRRNLARRFVVYRATGYPKIPTLDHS